MKEALKNIKKNKIAMFKFRVIDWKYVNISFFPDYLKNNKLDLLKYKKKYINKINIRKKVFLDIKNNFQKNLILSKEIDNLIEKIEFCKDVYDVEANKIDNKYKISKLPDYDFYSYKFYWINKNELEQINYLPEIKNYNIFFDKQELIKLIDKVLVFFPELRIIFSNVPNFVYNSWKIYIPDKEKYSIQEIIVIFFHELSHYIRWYNMQKNLWFVYAFSDNYELEEWIALYNEYFYWNQIIDYWNYYPYYHKVYNILMQDISKEDKLEQMYEILKYKGFSKEKTYNYFLRFYRFTPIGWNDFLLKEAIYYNSYKNILNLINGWVELDYLMSMKWGIESIDYFLKWKRIKNVNYKKYFETMVKEIKKVL